MPPVRQVLLVCASCLSSGIVTLPAATHPAGFLPAAATLVAVWLCAVGCALMLLEAASVAGERPNIPTMLHRVLGLGSAGRLICCALYVVTYGTALAMCLVEAGRRVGLLIAVVTDCLGTDLVMHCYTLTAPKGPTVRAGGSASPHGHKAAAGAPHLLACTLCLGLALWRGRGAVERWCSACVLGACLAFGALVHYATTETWTTDLEDAYAIGPGHTQATGMAGLLTRVSWLEMRKPLASITTALSLHIVVVPSVFEAANYNLRQASRAIVLGSLLALLLTVAWQAVVFSSMPLSDHGPPLTGPRLLEGLREVAGMSLPLFSLLALGGSMLGLGLGCVDWALDAARSVAGNGSGGLGRGEAVGLVLAPCVVAAMLAPTHVHAASGLLRRSGIAGVVCGALPLALGWRVRLQTRRGNDVKPNSPRESPSKGWRPVLLGGLPVLLALTLATAALLLAGLGGEEHS
eukprot:COSAG04_NODE_1182_length_7895_cov_17.359019_5_plen_463_part_00